MIDYNYPDIFMGEAVQKNLLITDGTVTVSGDTYTVTGDTVTITNSELETEAFELHQSINSDMQLRFGSCESAYISFVFRKTNITTLIGKTLKVYIIPNHEASKILQLGVFKVQTDKLSYDGTQRQITAYDAMYDIINSDVTDWYNTQFPNATTTKSLGLLIESFLDHFGLTAENLQSLVNKTRSIRRTIDPEQLSGADVIRAMCEINGVFGMITNEGNFRFKKLLANMRSESAATLVHEIPIAEYMDIHFEDYDAKKIDAAKIISDKGSDSYAFAPNPVNIYVISGNFLISDYDSNELHRVLMPLRNTLYNNYYTACTVNALGNPVLEPGDSIKVITKQGVTYTYILERHMRGVQALRDTYTAHGEEYSSESLNSISSRFNRISQSVSQAASEAIAQSDNNFVEIIRNIGFRLLDEPTNVSINYDPLYERVELKYSDPDDIEDNKPVTAEWAGTVVVRKENELPLHRWDGDLVNDSTTHDEYSASDLQDGNVSVNKVYNYGIFPYDTRGWYRYTKVVQVATLPMPIPEIEALGSYQNSVTARISIPDNYQWSSIKLVYKKDSAPQNNSDGKSVTITQAGDVTVQNLAGHKTYYFRLFSTEQTSSREFACDAQHIVTGEGGEIEKLYLVDADEVARAYATYTVSRLQVGNPVCYATRLQGNPPTSCYLDSSSGDTQPCFYWFCGDNGTISFVKKIPGGVYSRIYLDIRIRGRDQSWDMFAISCNSTGILTGYYRGNYSGTTYKTWILSQYNSTAASINSQTGIVINSTDGHNLSRQIVELDISDISDDFYIVAHLCGWGEHVYIYDMYADN